MTSFKWLHLTFFAKKHVDLTFKSKVCYDIFIKSQAR
nr:MAG TPA_asm: hypothetical protein [Caudoviricetes sp.]